MSKKDTALIKSETSLALPSELGGDWGTENLESKDVLIARILVAQKMSDAVEKSDVKPGQFYRSTDKKVYGGQKVPFEFLVINSFKQWTVEEKKGDRFEFESIRPYSPADANLPWDFEELGITKRRNETFCFYILPIADIEASEVLPSVISFRRTQVQCAKAIISYMMLMKQYKTPACTYVVELTSTLHENDLGSFHVPEMKRGRKATIEEMTLCKQWFDSINRGGVKVDTESVDAL